MKVSCIIPAFNEEKSIVHVLRVVKQVSSINEIIVVDDGSSDQTAAYAEKEGVIVLKHKNNKGKGAAIKTGSAYAKGEVLLFLDADLESISPRKIKAILHPIKNNEADFVKTSFSRARGRVTELVVKPLFQVVFPFVPFQQPLSGQFALRKEILEKLTINDQWGVDIQILLQSLKNKTRIKEVDIGHLVHKKQPIENLTVMSQQVIETILQELGIIANKHKLILFDFDKTLISMSSIEIIAEEFGFQNELKRLRKQHKDDKIRDMDITLQLAQFLANKTKEDIENVCQKIPLTDDIEKVIDHLKKRRYKIGIISHAFSPVVEFFAKKLEISLSNIVCPTLVTKSDGTFSGEVAAHTLHNASCCASIICKADAAKKLMEKYRVSSEQCIAVADGKSDACLFRSCGLAIAYKPLQLLGDIQIEHMSQVLIHAE